jgi:hypothetical protein
VIVGSEVRGRWMGGFDRNLRAVALSRLVGQRLRMLSSKPRQEDLQVLRELIEAGKVTPVIDRTYPLREVPETIRYLVEGHGGGGKIVITVPDAISGEKLLDANTWAWGRSGSSHGFRRRTGAPRLWCACRSTSARRQRGRSPQPQAEVNLLHGRGTRA